MSKDSNAPESFREAKRAQFAQETEGRSGKNAVKILALVAVALAAVVAYFVVAGAGGERATAVAGGGAARAAGEGVSIPLSELSGKARFYEYKTASGKTVRFFAVKSSDGVYRAALDACDSCFHAKKGYSQEGEEMVCNNCGMHFHSAKINEVKGGCNPIGLERKIAGDRLNVSAEELEAGANYF
ncbi:MAG TPA: DUF2318 domain-containing protein [Pyrinomonadaceae bacterium]|nr:DUF2318 domain-containing protein [Pyrinomonadaceae bacterium]